MYGFESSLPNISNGYLEILDNILPMIARPLSDPDYSRLQSHYLVLACHRGSRPSGYRGVQDAQELLATLSLRYDLHRLHSALCLGLWQD